MSGSEKNVPDVAPLMEDWGNSHYGSLNSIYWPIFWGAGGEIVDEEGNLTIDTEAGLEATKYIYKPERRGAFAGFQYLQR